MVSKTYFKQLFDTYFDAIRHYIYYKTGDVDTASDLAQDVFMRLWEKRATLQTDNLKALLYKMASDQVVSQYRKGAVRVEYAQQIRYQGEEEDLSPQQQAEYHELKQQYAKALASMPEAQRITFLMSREEELKYHEIAERLTISVKAVEKRMSAALQVLKSKLG